jgi:hypothetical protein
MQGVPEPRVPHPLSAQCDRSRDGIVARGLLADSWLADPESGGIGTACWPWSSARLAAALGVSAAAPNALSRRHVLGARSNASEDFRIQLCANSKMNIFDFRCHVLMASAALVVGCSGNHDLSSTLVIPKSLQAKGAAPDRLAMISRTGSGALLYISSPANGIVYFLTYPEGKLVGKLTGFQEPFGLCSDTAGNVSFRIMKPKT